MIYNPGLNRWERFNDWPGTCAEGCATGLKPLYLQAGFGLGFDKPAAARMMHARAMVELGKLVRERGVT